MVAGLLLVSSAVVFTASPAVAQTLCALPNDSQFDGYAGYGLGGNDGGPYRGVQATISTRLGYACDSNSNDPLPASVNVTTVWVMLASPTGNSWAQDGFIRRSGGAITTFFQNFDGVNAPTTVMPFTVQAGDSHLYDEDYSAGCRCIASYIDNRLQGSTNFDPIALRGSGYWSDQANGETKNLASDIPGHHGSSTFLSHFGSKTSTQGYTGFISFSQSENNNMSRWALGALDEFPQNVYGYNFQVYSY
jgi:hypothetical protein